MQARGRVVCDWCWRTVRMREQVARVSLAPDMRSSRRLRARPPVDFCQQCFDGPIARHKRPCAQYIPVSTIVTLSERGGEKAMRDRGIKKKRQEPDLPPANPTPLPPPTPRRPR